MENISKSKMAEGRRRALKLVDIDSDPSIKSILESAVKGGIYYNLGKVIMTKTQSSS